MAIVNGLFSVKSLFSNSTTVPFCNCQLNETVTVGGVLVLLPVIFSRQLYWEILIYVWEKKSTSKLNPNKILRGEEKNKVIKKQGVA